MNDIITRILNSYSQMGVSGLLANTIQKSTMYICYTLNKKDELFRKSVRDLLGTDDVNVCYNQNITQQYNPNQTNILVVIESPAVIKDAEWIDYSLEFDAEISFENFFELDNYYCPRTIYAGFDDLVGLEDNPHHQNKSRSVSHVYSYKKKFYGHRLRHKCANQFDTYVDNYGTGTGEYLKNKRNALSSYRFHIAIESAQHPEYVSEKFYDPIKTNTVPIYRGGQEAIKKMGFDTDGVLFFDTLDELEEILEKEVSVKKYQNMLKSINYNKKRLRQIRNKLKYELYLDEVRTGFLTKQGSAQEKVKTGSHLKPE